MTRGLAIEVTAEALTYQWAEIAKIARGFGNEPATSDQAAVYWLCSSVFIGLP